MDILATFTLIIPEFLNPVLPKRRLRCIVEPLRSQRLHYALKKRSRMLQKGAQESERKARPFTYE